MRTEVGDTRALTAREVEGFTPAPKAGHIVQTMRDSHHRVARLVAQGLRNGEVAEATGYSLESVKNLKKSPAFQELAEKYRLEVDAEWRDAQGEYYSMVNANRVLAARLLNDKLASGGPDDFTVAQLVAVHSDAADRTGFPKRSVAVNINADFAALLDRAVDRSARVIESSPVAAAGAEGERALVGSPRAGEGLRLTDQPLPPSLRRRVA